MLLALYECVALAFTPATCRIHVYKFIWCTHFWVHIPTCCCTRFCCILDRANRTLQTAVAILWDMPRLAVRKHAALLLHIFFVCFVAFYSSIHDSVLHLLFGCLWNFVCFIFCCPHSFVLVWLVCVAFLKALEGISHDACVMQHATGANMLVCWSYKGIRQLYTHFPGIHSRFLQIHIRIFENCCHFRGI